MPPNFWMSSVASSCTTSTMSSTVTMPFMRPSASTTGMARKSCCGEELADSASWSISSATVTTSVRMMSRTRLSGGAANSSRNDTTPSRCCSASST